MFVPVSKPQIDDADVEAVAKAVRETNVSGLGGPELTAFEEAFAAYCEASYGVATNNGNTALHLAMATLGIGPGDEVLVSTLTNMSSFFSVLYQGAKPIGIDSEPRTGNINPELLEASITPKTKAILVVHLYGHPVDMDPIMAVAKKHNLYVVEDCAEAHGALYKGKKVGSLGDISCFSFLANKIMTTGEGGMLLTNNKEFAEKARSLRSLAFGKEQKFMHQDIGFNYRLSNVLAALGLSQLKKLDKIIERKRAIAHYYIDAFKDLPDFGLPVEEPYARNVYWMFHVVLRGNLKGKRKELMQELKKRGVETREGFIPFGRQQGLLEKGVTAVRESPESPIANEISENGFYLPSGVNITDEELAYVAKETMDVVRSLTSS